jgi:uncharacterized protein (DUF2267 family)
MPRTGISAFSRCAEQAQKWVNELGEDLNWSDARRAYHLMKLVLHAARDWVSAKAVADLSSQLHLVMRGMFFEGWDPQRVSLAYRKRLDFIVRSEADFEDSPLVMPAKAVGKVFALLERKLPGGELSQVRDSMPKSLRRLWVGD